MHPMHINFYDDPLQAPKTRDEVKLNQIGLYIYPEGRKVAVGLDITPFLERPSIEITVLNEHGERAAALTVIESLERNFTMTLHLRDKELTRLYQIQVVLYYSNVETREWLTVDNQTATFDVTRPGELIAHTNH